MLDVFLRKSDSQDQEEKAIKVSESTDKPIKSVFKTISWRILGTLDTILISYIITGKVTAAVSIGSVEVISKTILYYFHERLWANIHRFKINILKNAKRKKFKFRIGKVELSHYRKDN